MPPTMPLLPPCPLASFDANLTIAERTNEFIRSWRPAIRVAYGTWDTHKLVNGVVGILLQQLGFSVTFVQVEDALHALNLLHTGDLDLDASFWVRNRTGGAGDLAWDPRLMASVTDYGQTGFVSRTGVFMRPRKGHMAVVAENGRFYTAFNTTDLGRLMQSTDDKAEVRGRYGIVRTWNEPCSIIAESGWGTPPQPCPALLLAEGTPSYTTARVYEMVRNASLPLAITETNLSHDALSVFLEQTTAPVREHAITRPPHGLSQVLHPHVGRSAAHGTGGAHTTQQSTLERLAPTPHALNACLLFFRVLTSRRFSCLHIRHRSPRSAAGRRSRASTSTSTAIARGPT